MAEVCTAWLSRNFADSSGACPKVHSVKAESQGTTACTCLKEEGCCTQGSPSVTPPSSCAHVAARVQLVKDIVVRLAYNCG